MCRWTTAFCRIKAVYCYKLRVSFSISSINRWGKRMNIADETLFIISGKGEEKKGKKRNIFLKSSAILVHPIALAEMWKLNSRKPATGTRYVRSEVLLMATFGAHASRELDGKEKCSYIDNLIPIYPSRTIPSSPRRHWRLTIRLTCHRDLILKNLKATRLRPILIHTDRKFYTEERYFLALLATIRISDTD